MAVPTGGSDQKKTMEMAVDKNNSDVAESWVKRRTKNEPVNELELNGESEMLG